jgi:hypothetical protein
MRSTKNIKTETCRLIDSSDKEVFVLDGSTFNNVEIFYSKPTYAFWYYIDEKEGMCQEWLQNRKFFR